jgi:hypothetical protein
MSRLLHRLALASPFVAQASHDLESLLNQRRVSPDRVPPDRVPPDRVLPDRRPTDSNRHVFITGLARAGTTVLMRSLYQSGQFRSLTYRDMPFVLMPSTWSGISSLFRRHKAQEERAHGDRVMVDFDSPEAFEEIFWRSFCGSDYIFEEFLRPHRPDEEIIAQFRRFVGNVLASDGAADRHCYLSKNNNNLLRLTALSEAFPKAAIVIPFRDPVQHALSLKRQHELFLQTHARDSFSLDYMNWLGHHEFGKNHRPFRFGEVDFGRNSYGRETLDYWLETWVDAYSYVLRNLPRNGLLVSYERLCGQTDSELERLLAHAGLSAGAWAEQVRFLKAKPHDAPDQSSQLSKRAYEVHAELCRME